VVLVDGERDDEALRGGVADNRSVFVSPGRRRRGFAFGRVRLGQVAQSRCSGRKRYIVIRTVVTPL
jgi:hypothetical protein